MDKKPRSTVSRQAHNKRIVLKYVLGSIVILILLISIFFPFFTKQASVIALNVLKERINGRLEYKNITSTRSSITIHKLAVYRDGETSPTFTADEVSVDSNQLFKNMIDISLVNADMYIKRDKQGKANIQDILKITPKQSKSKWNYNIELKQTKIHYYDEGNIVPKENQVKLPSGVLDRLGLIKSDPIIKPYQVHFINAKGSVVINTRSEFCRLNIKSNISSVNDIRNKMGNINLHGTLPLPNSKKHFSEQGLFSITNLKSECLVPILTQAIPELSQANLDASLNVVNFYFQDMDITKFDYQLEAQFNIENLEFPNRPRIGPFTVGFGIDSSNPKDLGLYIQGNILSDKSVIRVNDIILKNKFGIELDVKSLPIQRLFSFFPELKQSGIQSGNFTGKVNLKGLKDISGTGDVIIDNLITKNIPIGTVKTKVSIKNNRIDFSNISANGPTIQLAAKGWLNATTKDSHFKVSNLQVSSSLANSLSNSSVKMKGILQYIGDFNITNKQMSAKGHVSGLSLESGSWSLGDTDADVSLNDKTLKITNMLTNTAFDSKLLKWSQRRYALPDLASIKGDLTIQFSPKGAYTLSSGNGSILLKSTFASKFDDAPTYGSGKWILLADSTDVARLKLHVPVRYRGQIVQLDALANIRSKGISDAKLLLNRDQFSAEVRGQFDINNPHPSGGFIIHELDVARFSPSSSMSGIISTSGSFYMDGRYFNIKGGVHSEKLQYTKIINNHKLEPIKNIDFHFDYKSDKCQFSAENMTFKSHPISLNGILEPDKLDMQLNMQNLSIHELAGCLTDLQYCNDCTIKSMNLKGKGNLQLSIKGSFDKSLVKFSYKPSDVEITNSEFDRVELLAHSYISLNKKIPPDYIELDSLVITGQHGSLVANGRVPVISSGEMNLKGDLKNFDIDIFSAFLPKLGVTRAKIASLEKAGLPITNLDEYKGPVPLNGQLNGKLNITGTFRKPFGSAQLTLDQGSIFAHELKNGIIDITIDEKGIRLDKLQLEVNDALIEGNGLLAKNLRQSIFNIRTTAFDLSVLQPFLGYKLKGTMELDISKQPDTAGMTGNIIGNQVIIAGIGFRTVSVKFETLGQDYMHIISANLRPQPMGNDVALGNFQLSGKIPLGYSPNSTDVNGNPLKLDLDIKIPEIQVEQLLALYPKLNLKCEGTVEGVGKITGTFNDPIPDLTLKGLIKNIRLPGGLNLYAVQMDSHIRHKDFDVSFYHSKNEEDLIAANLDKQNHKKDRDNDGSILGIGSSTNSNAVLAATGTYTLNPLKVFTVQAELNPEKIDVIRINNVINGQMSGKVIVKYNAIDNNLKLTGFSTIKSGSRLFVTPLAAAVAVDPKLPKLDLNLTLNIDKGCTMEFTPLNFRSGLYGKVKFGGSVSNLQATGRIVMSGGGFDLYRQRFRFIDDVDASNISFSSVDGLMPRITAKATTTVRRASNIKEANDLDVYITMNQTRLDQLNEATITSNPPRGKDTIIAALTGNLTNIQNTSNILDSVIKEELIALSMSRISRELENYLNLDRFEFIWYNDNNYFLDIEKQIYPSLYLSYSRSLSKDWIKPEELLGLRYSLLKQGAFNVSSVAKYDINGNTREGHRAGIQVSHQFDSPFAKGENSPSASVDKYIELNPYNFDYKMEIIKPPEIPKITPGEERYSVD